MSLTTLGQASFDWLVGIWIISNPNGKVVESWSSLKNDVFQGESYFVKTDGEKIPQETMQIKKKNELWYYIPSVKNQNEGKPISFKMIFMGKTEFISENPVHDFPQRISYRRIGDELFATIEGQREGEYSKYNFDYSLEE